MIQTSIPNDDSYLAIRKQINDLYMHSTNQINIATSAIKQDFNKLQKEYFDYLDTLKTETNPDYKKLYDYATSFGSIMTDPLDKNSNVYAPIYRNCLLVCYTVERNVDFLSEFYYISYLMIKYNHENKIDYSDLLYDTSYSIVERIFDQTLLNIPVAKKERLTAIFYNMHTYLQNNLTNNKDIASLVTTATFYVSYAFFLVGIQSKLVNELTFCFTNSLIFLSVYKNIEEIFNYPMIITFKAIEKSLDEKTANRL